MRNLRPRSILDVGCGFGKYAMIFREYLDIEQGRYEKHKWQTRIVAVETYASYITALHRYVYDKIIISDILDIDFGKDEKFDLIFMGDVIEHLEKRDALELLDTLPGDRLLISTPTVTGDKDRYYAEVPSEHHRSEWEAKDFRKLRGWNCVWAEMDRYMLTALLERK